MIAHNATGAAPAINGSMTATPAITIPSVAVTQADGTALKAAIAAGPKTGGIKKNPAHTGIRDGDLENGIIIHEYAHGISSRLTGGVGNSCLGGNEQAGEGWSDYLALTLTMDPTVDNPDVRARHGPVRAVPGRPPRRRHPPAAVLAQHGRSSRSPTTRSRPVAGSTARRWRSRTASATAGRPCCGT